MATLGETLYAARSAREETLEDVARVLRIRPAILHALETGNSAALPSGAVTKGFVRTYTRYLGLDDDQAVRLFEKESGPHGGKSDLVFPEIVEPARLPRVTMILTGVLITGLAVTSWIAYANRDALGFDRVAELPDRLVKLISGESGGGNGSMEAPTPVVPPAGGLEGSEKAGSLPVPEPPLVVGAGETEAGAAGASITPPPTPREDTNRPLIPAIPSGPVIAAVLPPLTRESTVSKAEEQVRKTISSTGEETGLDAVDVTAPDTPVPVPPEEDTTEIIALNEIPPQPGQTAPITPLFDGEGTIYGDIEGVPRVVIRALGDSWVQVRNGPGRTVFSRILRAGDIYRVPADPGLSMIAGSVGDLEFWVDGTALSPLGDKGRVRRDIPLDADRLAKLGPG